MSLDKWIPSFFRGSEGGK